MAAESNSPGAQEINNVVKEIVKSIIVLDHTKKPFKFSEIISNVNPKPTKKKLAQMFTEAKNYLKLMGLIVHEVEDITKKKVFIVTSETQPLDVMHKYAPEEEVSDRILLTFVLTYIFMKNGTVVSDKLFSHLRQLGIYNDSKTTHPYFGDVKKKVLTQFPEQLYLSLVKVASNADLFEVKWGQRAEIEIKKRSILEFICKQALGGKYEPEDYNFHYEQVLIQEGVEKKTNNDGNGEQNEGEEEMDLGNCESDIPNIPDSAPEGGEDENHGSVESSKDSTMSND